MIAGLPVSTGGDKIIINKKQPLYYWYIIQQCLSKYI